MTNRSILRKAIEAALDSESDCLVGAVVHSKGKILAVGTNDMFKTHPHYPRNIHAEYAALLKIQYRALSNLEITVVRVKRSDGTLAMARPCDQCMKMLEEHGIKKIHYSTGEQTIQTEQRTSIAVPEELENHSKKEWRSKKCCK